MALVKCPECGKENVSNLADSCPSCGYGLKAHFQGVSNQICDFRISGGVLLKYTGNDKVVTVPEGVVVIGESAFQDNHTLERVVLPSSVTEIRRCAFDRCDRLEHIVFSEQLRYVFSHAFMNCISLREATIPDGCKEIGAGAFTGCTALETLNIPESLQKIGLAAFEKCSALTHVSLSVRQIEQRTEQYYSVQDIFEETYDAGDGYGGNNEEYTAKSCGPWYLNYKKRKNRSEYRAAQKEWRDNNLCQYCGGRFKGVFKKTCVNCGKLRDY